MTSVVTGKPIWDTPAGDLGTIQEGEFYQLTLFAHDDITNTSKYLYYIMIAGELPEGVQCRRNGIIEGVPKAITSLQGVPLEVAENVKSKFTVRVFTAHDEVDPLTGGTIEVVDRLADRTFEITVAGSDVPVWTTQPSDVTNAYDGDYIEYQFEFEDPDPGNDHVFTVLNGTLPPGVTLTKDGLLSGIILPAENLPASALVGYDADGSNYDQYQFDHSTKSSSQNYEFTVELSDGVNVAIQTFNIFVYSKDDISVDSDSITADSMDITVDIDTSRVPYLTTKQSDLGTVRHDNYFAYQFTAIDVDGDPLEFALTTGDAAAFDATGIGFDATGIGFDRAETSLPPGLNLDIDTGFLYGYIPDVGLTDTTYTFGVQVKKKNKPSVISEIKFFDLRIIGAIDTDITWTNKDVDTTSTNTRLANMNNGDISHLYVEAVASSGAALQYRLKSGSDSSLPQGLELQPSGNITGQTSFQGFMLDGGSTTFDEQITTRLIVAPTVWDRTYTFTVEAFNDSAKISVFKTFEIYVDLEYLHPYETVYMAATPEQIDRDITKELLDNKDIFEEELIYRADDPNFGIAKEIRYNHAYGIKTQSLEEYVEAMKLNHYRKSLVLGDIKTAQALDIDGNVIYEVVYSEVQQKLKNKEESVSLQVARTPFFEDFLPESVIDFSKTASATTVTSDRSDVTADAGVEVVLKKSADSDEVFADSILLTADKGTSGTLIKVTTDSTTILADSTHTSSDETEYYDYRTEIEDLSHLDYVYPNSLDNMRHRIIDRLGQFGEVLPEWMKSKQTDGRVLGFTPAWVIAYAKPGKGEELKYNVENIYTKKINSIDFETDRYTVDKSHLQYWNTTNNKWTTGRETTFNKYIKSRDLTLLSTVNLATELGFSQIHNRTVDYVAALGGIDGQTTAIQLDKKKLIFAKQEGFDGLTNDEAFTKYNRDAEDTSELIPGVEQTRDDSTVNNQRMAVWSIAVNPITEIITLTLETQSDTNDYVEVLEGTKYGSANLFVPLAPGAGLLYVSWLPVSFEVTLSQTLFDGGSVRFISNKDTIVNDDRYDKYVLYPQHTIIGNQDYIKL